MSLFNKNAEKDQKERQKNLQFRYSLQEFMNDNGIIFTGLSELLANPESILKESSNNKKTEVFKDLLERNKELTIKIASKVLGKPENEVSKYDVKPFRAVAASFIVNTWKKEQEINLDKVASVVADSISDIHSDDEFNLYRYLENSPEHSIQLTAANINLKLLEPIMVYDFRAENPEDIMHELSQTVLDMAKKSVESVLGDKAHKDDRISLLQTTSNHLASIMVSCYERRAFYFIKKTKNKTEKEIQEIVKAEQPLKGILSDFNKWAVMFSSSAFVYAKAIQDNKQEDIIKSNPASK